MERCQDLLLDSSIKIPSTSKLPFFGSSKPSIISTVVVLPLPVSPTIPTIVFAEILKSTFFNILREEFG